MIAVDRWNDNGCEFCIFLPVWKSNVDKSTASPSCRINFDLLSTLPPVGLHKKHINFYTKMLRIKWIEANIIKILEGHLYLVFFIQQNCSLKSLPILVFRKLIISPIINNVFYSNSHGIHILLAQDIFYYFRINKSVVFLI